MYAYTDISVTGPCISWALSQIITHCKSCFCIFPFQHRGQRSEVSYTTTSRLVRTLFSSQDFLQQRGFDFESSDWRAVFLLTMLPCCKEPGNCRTSKKGNLLIMCFLTTSTNRKKAKDEKTGMLWKQLQWEDWRVWIIASLKAKSYQCVS